MDDQHPPASPQQRRHPGLVGTHAAARAVGIRPDALTRLARQGTVVAAGRTPGGHLRWDVEELRAQLVEQGQASSS